MLSSKPLIDCQFSTNLKGKSLITNHELNLILHALEAAKDQLNSLEFSIRQSNALVDFYMTLSKVEEAINLVRSKTYD